MRYWRPYTPEWDAGPSLEVKRASGAHLELSDGRRIFDGISSWWLVNHGHGEETIARAIQKQAAKLAQVVFANFTHEAAGKMKDLLSELLPRQLSHAFLSDNGSTAVEVALKMAHQYHRLNGQPERRKFIAFSRGYHGDTCGAMSVSSQGPFTAPFRDLLFEIIRCEQGLRSTDPLESWTHDFERTLEERSHEVGAVILEPLLQGAGGMIIWPQEALKKVCALARRHGLLVIFDEVMTGFGRTGSCFAFEKLRERFQPDFLCLSKGLTGGFLPMGLTVATTHVADAFRSGEQTFFHGHSFTGNALSCAAAAANLEIWLRQDLTPTLSRIEQAQKKALATLPTTLGVREVRVCGTVGVLELEESAANQAPKWSRSLTSFCLDNGVFVRPLGSTVYLMPPYCASDDEIDSSWQVIAHGLSQIAESGGRSS